MSKDGRPTNWEEEKWMALEAAFGPILREWFPESDKMRRWSAALDLVEAVKARQDWFKERSQ